MGTRTWYVTEAGAKVNFGTAVVNGAAVAPIYKIAEGDETAAETGRFRRGLWRATGALVSAADITRATTAQSADAVPSLAATFAAAPSALVNRKDVTGTRVASVSGAVTLDARVAAVHVLTVTGNITSFTFSNLAAVPGKTIEVHFVQDATGGRTLSGVNASAVKLTGGALALTSGAGKRDVLRLRVLAGVANESGRALNV